MRFTKLRNSNSTRSMKRKKKSAANLRPTIPTQPSRDSSAKRYSINQSPTVFHPPFPGTNLLRKRNGRPPRSKKREPFAANSTSRASASNKSHRLILFGRESRVGVKRSLCELSHAGENSYFRKCESV